MHKEHETSSTHVRFHISKGRVFVHFAFHFLTMKSVVIASTVVDASAGFCCYEGCGQAPESCNAGGEYLLPRWKQPSRKTQPTLQSNPPPLKTLLQALQPMKLTSRLPQRSGTLARLLPSTRPLKLTSTTLPMIPRPIFSRPVRLQWPRRSTGSMPACTSCCWPSPSRLMPVAAVRWITLICHADLRRDLDE